MPLTGNPKVRGIIVDVLNTGNGCLGCHKIIDGWGCLLKNDYFCKKYTSRGLSGRFGSKDRI